MEYYLIILAILMMTAILYYTFYPSDKEEYHSLLSKDIDPIEYEPKGFERRTHNFTFNPDKFVESFTEMYNQDENEDENEYGIEDPDGQIGCEKQM